MAATCSYYEKGKGIRKHEWHWTSHSDGSVASVGGSDPITGLLRQVEFEPSVLSGYEPSSGYDVTMVDSRNLDWLFGIGGDIPNSRADALCLKWFKTASHDEPLIEGQVLTPSITNAGDTKKGVIRIWTIDPKWM